MMGWSACAAVGCDPKKVGRSWVFHGTRVLVVEADVERTAARFVSSAQALTLRLVKSGLVA